MNLEPVLRVMFTDDDVALFRCINVGISENEIRTLKENSPFLYDSFLNKILFYIANNSEKNEYSELIKKFLLGKEYKIEKENNKLTLYTKKDDCWEKYIELKINESESIFSIKRNDGACETYNIKSK